MTINCDTTRYIKEVLEDGEYKFVFNHFIVMDLGCNIGSFSLWIYKAADKIYAIDMVKRNIDNLKKTIKDNNLQKIKPYCCAIAGKTERRKAYEEVDFGDGSSMLTNGNAKSTFFVNAYSLNDFMIKNNIPKIDILKIDVEGAEHEIFNAVDFPSNKINTIVGEWHNESLASILSNLGYSFTSWGTRFLARKP